MPTSAGKSSLRFKAARQRAARKAEQVGKLLQSFAADLNSLDESTPAHRPVPTPRNWWHLQAGRFKDDSAFFDFVAQVQAARKREG